MILGKKIRNIFYKERATMYFKSIRKNGFKRSWKDYSFSTGTKEVSFDVYQRSSDKPLLRITKNLKPGYFNEKFFIKDKDGKIIKRSENLNQLIKKTSWNKLKLIK